MHSEIGILIGPISIAFYICTVVVAQLVRIRNPRIRKAQPRNPAGTDSIRWQYPFGHPAENWGRFELRIGQIFADQRPLEVSPWHTPGGDWIFFECQIPGANGNITIGARNGQAANSAINAWGEAILAISDCSAAGTFLNAFGAAFYREMPARREGSPRGFLRVPTAVFGTELGRLENDGFGGKGDWTATKWFLQSDELDAEVFFNFNIKERQAEFCEKDPDYRDDLISLLATALRDGPLAERTIESDPTLTLDDPTFRD